MRPPPTHNITYTNTRTYRTNFKMANIQLTFLPVYQNSIISTHSGHVVLKSMINVLDFSSMMKAEGSHLPNKQLSNLSYRQHRRHRGRDVYSMMSWKTSVLCWPEDTARALEPRHGRMGGYGVVQRRWQGLQVWLISSYPWGIPITPLKCPIVSCLRMKGAMVQWYYRASALPIGHRFKSSLQHVSIPFQLSPKYFMSL